MRPRARFFAGLAVLAAVAAAVPLAAAGPSSTAAPASKPTAATSSATSSSGASTAAQYFVKDVETSGSADELTLINYAFSNVAPDGNGNVTCQLSDPWADYQRPVGGRGAVTGEADGPDRHCAATSTSSRAQGLHPDLKVLISIGGWTLSKYFSDAALTEESRKAFVSSCIDLFYQGQPPRAGGRHSGPASPPACSTASTSTGSGRARRGTPATSSARRTSRTSRSSCPSSASSSATASRLTPAHARSCPRAWRRSTRASRCPRSSGR